MRKAIPKKRVYLLDVKIIPTLVVLGEDGRPEQELSFREPWVLRYHELERLREMVQAAEAAATEAAAKEDGRVPRPEGPA